MAQDAGDDDDDGADDDDDDGDDDGTGDDDGGAADDDDGGAPGPGAGPGADDDGGGAPGGGGGGGGTGAGGGGGEASNADLSQDDDGENFGPDDCFEDAMLRPQWLRECGRVKPARPATAGAVAPRVTGQGRSGAATPAGLPSQSPGFAAVAAEPRNAIEREVVITRAGAADVSRLESQGFVVLSRTTAGGFEILRLQVPEGLSTAEALALARQSVPGAIVDFNHIYRPAQAYCDTLVCRQRRAIRWPEPPAQCLVETSIGLIDTTIDRAQPALAGQPVELLDGISSGRTPAGAAHGTAIAALLAGRTDAVVPGLLPRARLTAVQAFHRADNGEDIADAYDIVRALDVMLQRSINVVNLSFTGPNNKVLAAVTRAVLDKGVAVVAAAGNLGPAGPVVYPAGYENVVAVTALGEDLRVYRGANRGAYIDFAAPGVDVQVVSAKVASTFESGTSFAAPFVTAAIAAARARSPQKPLVDIVTSLQSKATDLGRPGRDTVFGWGLVQLEEACP